MHFAFTSLLNSVLNWPKKNPPKRSLGRRPRRLLGEHLETRYALAGDLEVPEIPLPPVDGSVVSSVETTLPPDPGTPPPMDPGMMPPDPATTPPEDPQNENLAPVISDFTFVTDGNWITLRGLVGDDQDPTGYMVELSGIITATLTVGPDNTFSYTFQVTPEYSGTIFAQTHDFVGLLSNIASVSI
jgi:hypothetical protein